MFWEQFAYMVIAPIIAYLFGVWVGSEAYRRDFKKSIQRFERDTTPDTPRVRMTRYQRIIDSSKRTIRLADWNALRLRKRVQLNYRDTDRIPSDQALTTKMTKKQ